MNENVEIRVIKKWPKRSKDFDVNYYRFQVSYYCHTSSSVPKSLRKNMCDS